MSPLFSVLSVLYSTVTSCRNRKLIEGNLPSRIVESDSRANTAMREEGSLQRKCKTITVHFIWKIFHSYQLYLPVIYQMKLNGGVEVNDDCSA